MTLSLPEAEDQPAHTPVVPTAPYVAGYVFVDANQNGQRDAGEPGFEGVIVSLGSFTSTTAADGYYLFHNQYRHLHPEP